MTSRQISLLACAAGALAVIKRAHLSGKQNNPQRKLLMPTSLFAERAGATAEINISGNRMLAALVLTLCLAGPLLWGFVRYWLFAP
jgi:hypothetical protein